MQALIELFDRHGPLLVFFNVLVEQLGVPVPAVPGLMVAGALSVEGRFAWHTVLFLAVLGSGIANFAWYLAGRHFGVRILGVMCRISLSPDACVRRTENVFARWGVASLLVARFVPGLSAVASPLAGAMGLPAGRFVLFDSLGTSLWAGAFIGLGVLLHRQVEALIDALSAVGSGALMVLAALLALYVAWRWFERHRLLRFVRLHRIDVDELQTLMQRDTPPVIVDVRSASARAADARRIPGAIEADLSEVLQVLQTLRPIATDRDIVFYCNCPNEASAAHAARLLKRHGFKRVRPLTGGLDAWMQQVQRAESAAAVDAASAAAASNLSVKPAMTTPNA